jgi:glyceraldehyde 3-phosphate dehydrogenase
MTVRVGINGLGRIGRAIYRIMLERPDVEVVAINDVNPDIENMAYLLKYDSTYGKLGKHVDVDGQDIVVGYEKRSRVFHKGSISDVPWGSVHANVVVDASGVKSNLALARELKGQGVQQCVVTNSPEESHVDTTIVMGVNHSAFDVGNDFLIASSICDANAIAPVAHVLNREYGIQYGFLTTLHPWLNYQNVLDGPSISYATPGAIHDHYALGRGSTGSLIPKTTSAVSATCKVLKELEGKFLSMSYRVPTKVVTSADVLVKLEKDVTVEDVKTLFVEEQHKQEWNIFYNNTEPLVSTDFTGCEYSAVVDHRWIMKNNDNYLKMVLWYDNEWGYSSRVVDLVAYLGSEQAQ